MAVNNNHSGKTPFDYQQHRKLIRRTLIFILIIALLVSTLYFVFFNLWAHDFAKSGDDSRRVTLTEKVNIAYHTIEPVLADVRQGKLSKAEGLEQVRNLVRRMTYRDLYGDNYIFMSAYDGTMLVQPYEPKKEGTSQWDLQDDRGTYIIRELARSAKEHPEGGFVSYYYSPPNKTDPEEKISYVMGIPELGAYIGTGMYMHQARDEQRRLFDRAFLISITFVILMSLPMLLSLRQILSGSRQLEQENHARLKAQEDLAASQERLQLALDAANEALWDWNVAENDVYFSPRYYSMLGYEPGEFPHKYESFSALVHPEDIEGVEKEIALIFNQEKMSYAIEFRMKCKDERWMWIESRGRVVSRSPGGETLRMVGTHTPINRRKLAEQALEESKNNLRAVFDSVYDAIILHDVKGKIIQVNQRMLEIFQTNQEDVHKMSIEDISQPGYPQMIRVEEIWKRVVDGEDLVFEWKSMRRASAEIFDAEVALRRTTWSGEKLVLAVVRDITERKRAENALRTSEEKFRAIIEQLSEGFVLVNAKGKIVEWNNACEQIAEIKRQDALGKFVWDIQTSLAPKMMRNEDFRQQIKNLVLEALQNPESSIFFRPNESELHVPGGEIKFIHQIMFPIRSQPGAFIGVVLRDVSRRRQAEEEIRALNAELERRVIERTAQLEAANREMESFAYSVSHDLRAPLRSMDGFSQMLLEEYSQNLDETALGYLRRIRAASQRMGNLIDSLLKLSRVTRGDLQYRKLDLIPIANEIANDLQSTDPQRQVTWLFAPTLKVTADPVLIRTVMVNLLSNAWKFTSKTQSACIELGSIEEDGRTVYFVRDNGAGFEMNYAAKLFGAFQRLHRESEFQGTGIGLAIVQRIILRHGGRIWAKGEPNQGATFYFTLS